MQRIASVIVLLVLGALSLAAQRNIDGLKEEADRAEGGHQAKLCSELAKYLVAIADEQFSHGNVEQAQTTVQDILKYAQKARDAAIKNRDDMKATELRLRETQRQLEAVRRTVAVEDRPPLEGVEKKIEQFRLDLLDAMFGLKKKEKT